MYTNRFLYFLVFLSVLSGIIGSFIFSFFGGYKQKEYSLPQEEHGKTVYDMSSLQSDMIQIAEKVYDSTVSIIVQEDLSLYRNNPYSFFRTPVGTVKRQTGGGTGFFVREDGVIVTNKHVVAKQGASYTVITSDNREFDAEVLAFDPLTDLAVLKIETDENFPVLELIDDTENIPIGQFVVAVGNALAEFKNSISFGIISGKNRSLEASGYKLAGLLQTDAAINPGNSGGPLVNLEGSVVGMNTAIAVNSDGIGFSIPLSKKKIDYILDSIEQHGEIKRPFIGINYILLSEDIARELGVDIGYGAYISKESGGVVEGSNAQEYGITSGDIILEIDGEKITFQNDLSSMIQNRIPGEMLNMRILKSDGTQQDISFPLGSR